MKPDHIASYYAASAHRLPDYPHLQGSHDYDVGIIGGGITGCSAALHLAERGYRVALLEAARIGWGASGRNGGQALTDYACGIRTLQDMLGLETARQLWAMSLDAVALLKQRVAQHRIDCDLTPGALLVALKSRQLRELQTMQLELEQYYEYQDLQFIPAAALRERVDSTRYCAGLYDPNSVHLHPLNYTLGMAAAAQAAGADIFEDSAALKLSSGLRPRAHTEHGEIRCQHLILAGNAYLDTLSSALQRKIMPVGTYIIATEPLSQARAERLVRNHAAVSDMNFVLDYYRCSGRSPAIVWRSGKLFYTAPAESSA